MTSVIYFYLWASWAELEATPAIYVSYVELNSLRSYSLLSYVVSNEICN